MPAGRPLWIVLIAAGILSLAGCEPYMSITDRIPAQTRQAVALLPETPRYVGMVDVQTTLRRLNELKGENLADSLRRTESPYLHSFLDATGLDLKKDVQAVYGVFDETESVSAVLFANLTPEQMDRYLEAAPGDGGETTTYRDVPLYHLAFTDPADTLSVAFLEDGLLAVGMEAAHVTAMVDRHQATEQTGLGANEDYMTLVKRVGHGSTAWLAGRDVLKTALRDSAAAGGDQSKGEGASRVSQAGLQRALTEWTDRVLGLSEVNVSSFEGRAQDEVDQLKRQMREQAVSITLTDATLRGEVYLTMRDNASASSMVDVAEGAVAVAKLSKEKLDDRQRDLLDGITIERSGPIVHVQFALDEAQIREQMTTALRGRGIRRASTAIRHSTSATRRIGSITQLTPPLQSVRMRRSATNLRMGLSTPSASGARGL